MITSLYSGLTEEQRKTLDLQAAEAQLLIKQVRKYLRQKQRTCESKRRGRGNYFMPAWKEYQADCNGYLRAYEEILDAFNSMSSKRTSDQEAYDE